MRNDSWAGTAGAWSRSFQRARVGRKAAPEKERRNQVARAQMSAVSILGLADVGG